MSRIPIRRGNRMRLWTRTLVNFVMFLAMGGFLQCSVADSLPKAFYVPGSAIALLPSFVLAPLNAVVKPILFVLSPPVTILSLGLFSVAINSIMIALSSWFVG